MFAVGSFGHSDRMLEGVCAPQYMLCILCTFSFAAMEQWWEERENEGGGVCVEGKGVMLQFISE